MGGRGRKSEAEASPETNKDAGRVLELQDLARHTER